MVILVRSEMVKIKASVHSVVQADGSGIGAARISLGGGGRLFWRLER